MNTYLQSIATFILYAWIHLIHRNQCTSSEHVRTPNDCSTCSLAQQLACVLRLLNREAQRSDEAKTIELILRDDVTVAHDVVRQTILQDCESRLWETTTIECLCKMQVQNIVAEVWDIRRIGVTIGVVSIFLIQVVHSIVTTILTTVGRVVSYILSSIRNGIEAQVTFHGWIV